MSQLNLVLSGSAQSYAGLVYSPSNGAPYLAEFSKLDLEPIPNSSEFKFEWSHLTKIPAVLSLVNERRIPGSPLPLENGVSWYLALEISESSGKKYYPLKYINDQLQFVNEDPNESNTIRVVVPSGLNLNTNDVETRFYVRLGNQLLIDQLTTTLSCPKLYLSPYTEPVQLTSIQNQKYGQRFSSDHFESDSEFRDSYFAERS